MLRMVSGLVYSLGYFMRQYTALLTAIFAAFGVSAASGQACGGLACQQQTCAGNQTTTISGVVYAPNGTDPLPNVTVYVPNAQVDGDAEESDGGRHPEDRHCHGQRRSG